MLINRDRRPGYAGKVSDKTENSDSTAKIGTSGSEVGGDGSVSKSQAAGAGEHSPFNRALRGIFIVLILFALITGYAAKPQLNGKIRRVLKEARIVDVEVGEPDYYVPFTPHGGAAFGITHTLDIPGRQFPITMRTWFTRNGILRGSQSLSLPEPISRRSTERARERLAQLGHEIFTPPPQPRTFRLHAFWDDIADRFDLATMRGFYLYHVDYEFGADGPANNEGATRYPVIVLKMWCNPMPHDPLLGPDRSCPERSRVVYDLNAETIVLVDDML